MATANPEVFIAAEVEFDETKFSSPGSDLTLYFQKPENGGCGVLATLTPFQGNSGKAIVLFDPDDCEEDIVRDLNDSKSDPSLKISEYKDPKVFGDTSTYIEKGTKEKLLGAFKFETLRKRVRYQCGFDIELTLNSKRIKLRGNFTHIKLAEDCLKQIISDIDNKKLQVAPQAEEENLSDETGATQELQELDIHSQADRTKVVITKESIKEFSRRQPEGGEPIPDFDEEERQSEKTTRPKSSKPKSNKQSHRQSVAENLKNGHHPHSYNIHELEDNQLEEDTDKMGPHRLNEKFDRIAYEFMIIEEAGKFKKFIEDKFSKSTIDPTKSVEDVNEMDVEVSSPTEKEAKAVMKEINNLFQDVSRSLTPVAIKLTHSFTGERSGLRNSLKKLKGHRFVARLVTDEDIRILGYIYDIDKNINIVEDYIDDYMMRHPKTGKPVDQLPPVKLHKLIVRVECGDLLRVKCDAVVSSANPNLSGTGGVAKAVSEACGRRFEDVALREASRQPLRPGETFSQEAEGKLLSRGVKFVIHAVGPDKVDNNYKAVLTETIYKALSQAEHLGVHTVAFPAISSGSHSLNGCTEAYKLGLYNFSVEHSQRASIKEVIFVSQDKSIVREMHQIFSADLTSLHSSGQSSNQSAQRSPTSPTGSSSHQYKADRQSQNRGRTSHGNSGAPEYPGASGSGYPGASGYAGAPGYAGAAAGGDRGYGSSQGGARGFSSQTIPRDDDEDLIPPPIGESSRTSSASHRQGSSGLAGAGVHDYPSHRNTSPGVSHALGGSEQLKTDHRGRSGRGSSGQASATATRPPADDEDDYDPSNRCPICLDDFKNPKELPCKHKLCKECFDGVKKTSKSHQCPVCRVPFAVAEGTQPKGGYMRTSKSGTSLPGYPHHGTITIHYSISGGVQGPEHPSPGVRFSGTSRMAFLPDNDKGRMVERLLRKAFDQRLTFTVGNSITSGAQNTVVWNDIHHKTSPSGGPQSYGYPDPDYLDRVIDDLKARGIKE